MMIKSNIIIFGVVMFIFLTSACSKQVLLKEDKLQNNQTVTIQLKSGPTISGLVASATEKTITVVDKTSSRHEIEKRNIARITGPQPWYDADGALISEKEIAKVKTNKNFWLYTISGAALSAGASFFTSSMIARASDNESNAPLVTTGTIAGTLVGGFLFSRLGINKDREDAIESIRLVRSSDNLKKLDNEKTKQEKIQQEIDRLKSERETQDFELEKLRKELEKK